MSIKKVLTLILLLVLYGFCGFSQVQDSIVVIPLDKSPVDIVYFPVQFPLNQDTIHSPNVKVIYSRPQKNDREIFGNMVEYGKIWRLGANESTEITFFEDVKINNKKVRAGTYSLFAIPYKDKWTVIINAMTNKWGSYFYDRDYDVLRWDVPVHTPLNLIEIFTLYFIPAENGAEMVIAWEKAYTKTFIELKKRDLYDEDNAVQGLQ